MTTDSDTYDDEPPEVRTYWHSDHYTTMVGNGLVGPIWDSLHSHPDGVTVPEIVSDLVNDPRVRAAQSWFLSFGAEARHRQDSATANRWHERYKKMDPDSPNSREWTWDEERRYRYALTERVHWNLTKTMVANGYAVSAGRLPDDLSNSGFLQIITGLSHGIRDHLRVYMAGPKPLVTGVNPRCECGKSHHGTYKRRWTYHEGLGPDPWIMRRNWADEVEAALGKPRLSDARELLERGLTLMREVNAA